jgi:hypothetical protein
VINFKEMLARGMILGSDLDLFGFAETAEDIWTLASASGLKVHLEWRPDLPPQL